MLENMRYLYMAFSDLGNASDTILGNVSYWVFEKKQIHC